MELETMPRYGESLARVAAWFRGEKTDRPPVRFNLLRADNRQYLLPPRPWKSLAEKWADAEYQTANLLAVLRHTELVGETFPVYCPNLGPNVYAAFYRGQLTFGEDTSWIDHPAKDLADVAAYRLDERSVYLQTLQRMTDTALRVCPGQFLVGFTDLHPGMDCVADWRSPEELCLDLYDDPDAVRAAGDRSVADFARIYDLLTDPLRASGQPSVNWLGIPVAGRLHVPSCDFSALISPEAYREFCLPLTLREMAAATHNIYHLDGRDATRHLPAILDVPGIRAIQWAQGDGRFAAIQPWIPMLDEIRRHGKGVVVNVTCAELEAFMAATTPDGLYLCIDDTRDTRQQKDILRAVAAWGR